MPKSSNPKKAKPNTTIDVATTGKTADTGSRPIIVTNRPMVADPMVNKGKIPPKKETEEEKSSGDAPKATVETDKLAKNGRKGMVINPILEAEEPSPPNEVDVKTTDDAEEVKEAVEKAEEAVEAAIETEEPSTALEAGEKVIEPDVAQDSETEEPAEDKVKPDADEEAKTEESSPTEPEENSDADSGIVDELAKQAASKKQQQQEDKVAGVEREKLDELIAAKTYYVPTTRVAKRRVKNVLLTVIVLVLLVAVGVNFAADAGLIDIGMQPLTNIIAE